MIMTIHLFALALALAEWAAAPTHPRKTVVARLHFAVQVCSRLREYCSYRKHCRSDILGVLTADEFAPVGDAELAVRPNFHYDSQAACVGSERERKPTIEHEIKDGHRSLPSHQPQRPRPSASSSYSLPYSHDLCYPLP